MAIDTAINVSSCYSANGEVFIGGQKTQYRYELMNLELLRQKTSVVCYIATSNSVNTKHCDSTYVEVENVCEL